MSTIEIHPVINARMQLGECPVWHAHESSIYWIDIDGCAVHRFNTISSKHDYWTMPSQPGCIALCTTGELLVALRFGLGLLQTTTGELKMIADAPYDPATSRFNDGRCDAAGRLWTGTIYEPRDYPNAVLFSVERGLIKDSGKRATVSNGIAFSPDNKTLYYADTTSHAITAYDFNVDQGLLGKGRLLREFSRDKTKDYGGRPDGATVDSEGAYWCAMYEGGRLLRLSPAGEILTEIDLPARCPTMMAFGGKDLHTLFITTVSSKRPPEELAEYPLSGCLLSLRVDVAGRLENKYVI